MSIRLMTEVWSRYPKGGNKKLVLLALADYANDDGYCWPGVDLIAVKCNVSRRYVQQVTAELVDDGWLEIGVNQGPHNANMYQVKVPEGTVDAVAEHRKALQAKRAAQAQPLVIPERIVAAGEGGELQFAPGVNHSSPYTPSEPSNIVVDANASTTSSGEPTGKKQEPALQEKKSGSLLQGRKSIPDAQADTELLEPGDPPEWARLTPAQRYLLRCIGAKRYKNPTQAEIIARLEQDYGFEAVRQKIRWAAAKGLRLGDAVIAVESALDRPKGRTRGPSAAANPGKPGRTVIDPANIYARAERF
jgi:hypothetical protein